VSLKFNVESTKAHPIFSWFVAPVIIEKLPPYNESTRILT